jgi:hypothetical protein
MLGLSRKIILLLLVAGCTEQAREGEPAGTSPDETPASASVSITIRDDEAASMGSYSATVKWPDGRQIDLSGERDGSIAGHWLASIDGDPHPELIVWIVGAGSGSYATVHVYRMPDSGVEMIDASEIPHGARNGYQGHDRITVEDGVLRRCFPLYETGDPNSRPSGGERCLSYDSSGLWIIE